MTLEQNILVIDDEKMNLKIMHDMLNGTANVMMAISGEQGIRKAIEYQPDLILLDVIMPQMDGFETMNRLSRDARTSKIPVIFITALDDSSNEEKALLMGASDYIHKPLHKNIVQARVRLHLQLIKQRKMLEELAHIDPLTTLSNRRKYQDVMTYEWRAAINNQNQISLLVIDIDDFKQYNDFYGHAVGDSVLKKVASVLLREVESQGLESRDLVSRYGGEEFVILLPSLSQKTANDMAHACLNSVEKLNLATQTKDLNGKVTVSIGGTSWIPNESDNMDHFFNEADSMLMKAKNSGKNKVIWKNA